MTPSLTAPNSVLVLGAGWLGLALAESCSSDGARVTTVRRSPHAAPAGGQSVTFDLASLDRDDPPALPNEFAGHDLVVALVAPSRSRGDDHASIYPSSARAAVRIAAATGARALCWVSSTGVYGYADGRDVTEDTPRSADTPSQRALIEAEDAVLASASPSCRVVVLRASGLYGPGRDPAPRYADASAVAGRADQWVNLAWRDDVIGAIRCWAGHALGDTVPPQVLNVSDSTPLTVAECARLVARAEGRAFTMPEPPAADTTTVGAASRAPMRSNQRIRVDALRGLGWTPEVPNLRAGLIRLGYTRLAAEQLPYGPNTAAIREFLRALAALEAAQHDQIVAQWPSIAGTPAFARADRVLGELLVRAGREAERDAAAGPLLQMLRGSQAKHEPELDPIAEPALATLMALVVRDLLPEADFATLTAPCATLVPAIS